MRSILGNLLRIVRPGTRGSREFLFSSHQIENQRCKFHPRASINNSFKFSVRAFPHTSRPRFVLSLKFFFVCFFSFLLHHLRDNRSVVTFNAFFPLTEGVVRARCIDSHKNSHTHVLVISLETLTAGCPGTSFFFFIVFLLVRSFV